MIRMIVCLGLILSSLATQAQFVYMLQGTIKDVETREGIEEALVKILDQSTNEVVAERRTDKRGFYKFAKLNEGGDKWVLETECSYFIEVSHFGYLGSHGQETTVGTNESVTYVHDFGLAKRPMD